MNKFLSGSAVGLAAALSAGSAGAQLSDTNQPLPNVLVILDTSGSMSYMPDGSLPTLCQPNNPLSDRNRWTILVETLTGTINNYGCLQHDRSDPTFINEYDKGSVTPYDIGYHIDYYRPASNGCVPAPGQLPASLWAWSNQPIRYRDWADNSANGQCPANLTWAQQTDGLLDTYRDRVRFAMMMFDSHIDPGVGIQGNSVDWQTGFDGLFSYYDGWQTTTSPIAGHPANCNANAQNQIFEVGVRNYAAPPWEGRMIPFGDPQATIADVRFYNDRIQEIIQMSRPYGATPVAGAMDDAYVFFRTDTSIDPGAPNNNPWAFAPAGDPLVTQGCRESFIILLSDGEPNVDLRPSCEQSGTPNGLCPYPQPWERSRDLFTGTPSVKTFTIFFGDPVGMGYDCNTVAMPGDLAAGQQCENPTGSLAACCKMAQIAYEGGTNGALFASDQPGLRAALANILDQIVTQTTSRTLPVFASAAASAAANTLAPAISYEFGTAFRPTQGQLWTSSFERVRFECQNNAGVFQPVRQIPIDPIKGDDFAANVNSQTPARRFLTFIANPVNGTVNSDRSIRPFLGADVDGVGVYSGTEHFGDNTAVATAAQGSPTALGIASAMPAGCTSTDMQAASDSQCAFRLMNWELGGTNAGLPTRAGNVLGAIYHSTPQVQDRPLSFARDGAYETFADSNATRPLMMYFATVDGQVHAFKIAPNDIADPLKSDQLENNELWAFLPPAVLPKLLSQYPSTPQILLDGAVTVKDIPFQRTLVQAQAASATWKTVLVGGGYLGGGFYYALDVTDPTTPRFMWQLSSDAPNGVALFGPYSGNPAITTIALDEGSGVKEVAVAILPGGQGVVANPGNQNRQGNNFGHIRGFHDGDLVMTTDVTPDNQVTDWVNDESNNITIVELETGRIISVLRGDATAGFPVTAPIIQTEFDSPITDVVPFPNRTGDVSNRIYATDQDGTIWRVDLSSPLPAQWRADIYFDAYPSAPNVAASRQPIPFKPVISVDGLGNTVMLFSTGDNEDFTATGVTATIWSLTEVPLALNGVPFQVYANWVISPNTTPTLAAGERVVGPIAVFDEIAYFATFTPPANAAGCDFGSGQIYSVDFQENDQGGVPVPLPRFPDGANGFKYNPDNTDSPDLGNGATIFGVSVAAEPTCSQEVAVTDDYVGAHTTTAESVPTQFKLRFHTGAEGTAASGSEIKAGELAVAPPRLLTRIESWAGLEE